MPILGVAGQLSINPHPLGQPKLNRKIYILIACEQSCTIHSIPDGNTCTLFLTH